MRRTVLGSATKFWPRSRRGARPRLVEQLAHRRARVASRAADRASVDCRISTCDRRVGRGRRSAANAVGVHARARPAARRSGAASSQHSIDRPLSRLTTVMRRRRRRRRCSRHVSPVATARRNDRRRRAPTQAVARCRRPRSGPAPARAGVGRAVEVTAGRRRPSGRSSSASSAPVDVGRRRAPTAATFGRGRRASSSRLTSHTAGQRDDREHAGEHQPPAVTVVEPQGSLPVLGTGLRCRPT